MKWAHYSYIPAGDGTANLPSSLAEGLASRLQGGKESSFISQLF